MNTLTRLIVVLVVGATSSIASAQCTNDPDCSGAQCGGMVCQWATTTVHSCVAAGTDPQGADGWCTANTDCKCATQGATCNTTTHHCTFTLILGGGDMAASGTTDMAHGLGATNSGCSVGGLPPVTVVWPMLALLLLLAGRARRVRARCDGRPGSAPSSR